MNNSPAREILLRLVEECDNQCFGNISEIEISFKLRDPIFHILEYKLRNNTYDGWQMKSLISDGKTDIVIADEWESI